MESSAKRLPTAGRIGRTARTLALALALAAGIGSVVGGPASAREWAGYGRDHQTRAEQFRHQTRYDRHARFFARSFHRHGYGFRGGERPYHRGW